MAITEKAKRLVNNYITQKAIHSDSKISKKQLMLNAGYSKEMVENRTPENTKLYASLSNDMINKVGFILSEYIDSVVVDIEKGMHKELDTNTKIKQLNTLVSIYKGLSPSYREKQVTKDVDGTLKTVWKQLN